MKIKKMTMALVLAAGVIFGAGDANAGYITTQKAVAPGVWTSDFEGAKAYAEKNNVPMFVFWANTGCSHCETIEKDMNKDSSFQSWVADRKIVMVFVEANSTIKKWIKDNAKETIKSFPFAAVYWPKNTKGVKVLQGFSAYKGNMSKLGASSSDSNVQQIMDAIDYLIAGWKPGDQDQDPDDDDTDDDDSGLIVDPRQTVDPATFFKSSQKVSGVAYNNGELFGKVAVTIGKYSKAKNNLTVTTKITSFGGKTFSKSVKATPDAHGDILDMDVAFKSPIGEMTISLVNGEEGFEIAGVGDEYAIDSGDVVIGGKLEGEEATFSTSFDALEPENENFSFILDAPSLVSGTVKKGTSLDFGSAPQIKYVKVKEGGDTWYELADYDGDKYPNENALKLTYNYTTGAFTGSFKIYASNADSIGDGKKPTLKTYTAKVSGYVVNGSGIGTVTVKVGRKTYTGECTLD